ncbi:LemA family protein [Wenzhouxiangella marina]|uniref:Membrane protein n=1 Tax=Wenzhouxiangella marina TaxID=1579979 RepID=A0A0K0XXW8_9GAMM|nr:LemA family protein [Wenzhouxiangella marina]AKS42528.1 membrane protein [Wenzhouxiangella marina]MBB6085695.1 LemA protein [Wenzhouxiangella marina]
MEWIIGLALAALLAWAIWTYNRLVMRRNRVATAWSDVDVQLTRRHDLVPNLVKVVRAYAGHEKDTLEEVTRLRSEAVSTDSPARLGQIENDLEQLLSRLLVLKENYPDLKASDNFIQLSEQLVEVEDHLQYARRYYNGAVRDLNTQIAQFPDLIIARAMGFKEAEFYRADAGHRASVSVGALS